MRSYFISSTFSDMNSERDWFQREVLPKFREAAHSHGEEADVVDLRIGIDVRDEQEDSRLKKVLDICSKLITKCKPHMIVFIGDRYGYIADDITKEFEKELSEKLGTPVKGRSITDLEVDFGLFQGRSSSCIICMRTLRGKFSEEDWKKFFEQDESSDERLFSLTNKLKHEYGDKIIEYTANWNGKELEDFRTIDDRDLAEVLLERMIADCEADWLAWEKLSWQEQEENFAWEFATNRANNFFARQDTVDKFEILFERENIIFLKGDKGTGKTSLLSKIAADFRERGRNVRCIFSGASARSSNAFDILRQIVYFVESTLGTKHFTATDSQEPYAAYKLHLINLCRQLKEPLFVIVDAVDQLDVDKYQKILNFLPKADNIHCLVSGADFDFSSAKQILGGKEEILEFLETSEVEDVLRGILTKHGRDLFPEIAAVVRSKNINSPLYLEFVAQIFSMLSAHEYNNMTHDEVINATVKLVNNMSPELSAAAVYILNQAANRICENPDKALETIYLLAITPHGLRTSDVKAILRDFQTLDYELLHRYLHTFFFERQNGQIDFNHSLIRDGILNDLPKNYIDDCEHKITAHIKTLPTNDPLRCLEGATYAQKLRDYEFLAMLYDEATTIENPMLLYGIEQALRSDGGTICMEFLEKHFKNLDFKLLANCYAFFLNTFQIILRGSDEDYKIAQKILAVLPSISDDIYKIFLETLSPIKGISDFLEDKDILNFGLTLHYYTQEWNLARQKFLRREFPQVITRCKKIVNWGRKHFDFNESADFCRLMRNSYGILCDAYNGVNETKSALEAAEEALIWARLSLNSLQKFFILTEVSDATIKANEKLELANSYSRLALCKMMMDKPKLEKILEYLIKAHEIYSALVTSASLPEYFYAATINLLRLSQTNLCLKRIPEAKIFLKKCIQQTEILLEIYPYFFESSLNAGGIYGDIAIMEFDLNDTSKAEEYADKSILLYCNAIEQNPVVNHVKESLLKLLNIFAEKFTSKGDNVRAAKYKKLEQDFFSTYKRYK